MKFWNLDGYTFNDKTHIKNVDFIKELKVKPTKEKEIVDYLYKKEKEVQ